MHRSRKLRSVYSIVKEEFGLKGNKESVYGQFVGLIEEVEKQMQLPLEKEDD
jgi:hypothetical protein